ncbi:MAG: ABC transporter ATP-binding protein [Waterburya sp.]
MSESIIQVENLGKKYIIGQNRQVGGMNLRETITESAKSLGKKVFHLHKKTTKTNPVQDFWALKDVSLPINQGEIVGIIGRNGSGKSTLLKILSRITEPTTGKIKIKGRVASLLEVGTGFHSELTGRENIYLNGAILGMGKAEIKRKFDEIVAFAEVEKFLDTPVKRYSSGMYVRLAFAVAAHLEPEILIVDEVLAVGDAAFQKKCLGKMGDVATNEGRTVLFVSHNMATVRALCQKAYLLNSGQIDYQGSTSGAIERYMQSVKSLMMSDATSLEQRSDRSGDGSAMMIGVTVEDAEGQEVIRPSSRLKVTIYYKSDRPLNRPQFSATIYDDQKDVGMISLHSDIVGDLTETLPAKGKVTCVTEPIDLTPGRCYLNLSLLKAGVMADYIQYAVYFEVETDDVYGTGKLPGRDWVYCLRQQQWFANDEAKDVTEIANSWS